MSSLVADWGTRRGPLVSSTMVALPRVVERCEARSSARCGVDLRGTVAQPGREQGHIVRRMTRSIAGRHLRHEVVRRRRESRDLVRAALLLIVAAADGAGDRDGGAERQPRE